MPHARATHFPATVIITDGHGRGPLRLMLTPLVAAFDAVLGAVGDVVGRCLLIATRGCLPACLCSAVHDRLIDGGVLGGDAARFLKRAPEEVAMSALPWTLPIVIGQCAWAVLVRLATCLGVSMMSSMGLR
jgi:hypothetical protein